MATSYVPLICYFDGELQQNTSEPIYVGGQTKADRVRKNISFTEFVIKMHELCKSPPEETSIGIKCRYLLDQHKSIAMHVEDDNSLSIIMDSHPHQCNAIVVYVEKRPDQKSISTTRRNEKGSSPSGAGDRNHMSSTAVEDNVNQLTSKSCDNTDSLVIDIDPPPKDPLSLSRYGKNEQDKEVVMHSVSKKHEVRTKEYKTRATIANRHLEQSAGHLSENVDVNLPNDSNIQFLKSKENTDSSVLRSQDRGSEISSKPTSHVSGHDVAPSESSSRDSNSWFTMRVLDPKESYLQRWTRIFLLSSMLALALDALFFYTPGIYAKKSCLNWDKNLEITASVLRSIVDIIYILHIIFQFRTGFFVPSTRVFGKPVFVGDLGAIAKRYLSSIFLIDILSVLPLPQIMVLIIMPQVRGSFDMRKRNSLRCIVLLQYIPRLLRIYPLYKKRARVNTMPKTAWAGAAINFSLYMLASHVFGAFWYFLSVEREAKCWQDACRNTTTCNLYSLYCGNQNTGGNEFLQTSCPIIEPNTTVFHFGIYIDALQNGIPKSSFLEKFIYCFWWGLQNIGSFGQNLKTSADIWEVCFAVSISVFGLFLFMLLIGNVQTYLQSETVKAEKELQYLTVKEEIECRKKIHDVEQWMTRKLLPQDLRERVRQYELLVWQTTKGFDEEKLLRNLPKDIKMDIKRHFCLALLTEVQGFKKMDAQFLDTLCDLLKPVFYTEDALIIREGHPLDEMVFIMTGELLSTTTNTKGGNSFKLKAGNFIGEELLPWAIHPTNSSNPISTRTVQALKEVEAFALTGDDLKFAISQFRLREKQIILVKRQYSLQRRTSAAWFIQSAWLRYRKKKLEKSRLEEKNGLQGQLALTDGSNPSPGAAIYPSKFATHARRALSLQKVAGYRTD